MKELLFDENEYNPQKSQKLAEWCPAEYSGGFRHEAETLYMTEEGNYFVLSEGGLFSRYHEYSGSEQWYGGTHIRPVSREEAFFWCEETGNYDTIETHFSLSMGLFRRPG